MAASLLARCAWRSTRRLFPALPKCSVNLMSTTEDGSQNTTRNAQKKDGEGISESRAGERALAGFAKALEKAQEQARAAEAQDEVADDVTDTSTEHDTFPAMLRHSKLMQLGEISGRMVLGTIIEVVDDDLYIDYGGKFYCVCPRPKLNSDRYFRGVKVKVRLNDLEMTSSFLGSEKHVTLLESDGTLVGLRRQSS